MCHRPAADAKSTPAAHARHRAKVSTPKSRPGPPRQRGAQERASSACLCRRHATVPAIIAHKLHMTPHPRPLLAFHIALSSLQGEDALFIFPPHKKRENTKTWVRLLRTWFVCCLNFPLGPAPPSCSVKPLGGRSERRRGRPAVAGRTLGAPMFLDVPLARASPRRECPVTTEPSAAADGLERAARLGPAFGETPRDAMLHELPWTEAAEFLRR
jgi:hypothetical protein